MTRLKTIFVCISLFYSISGAQAQQSCYQIGLNEGREIYNEAQRLERSGRCVDAVPRYWEALRRFRLTRSCRDLPANHELGSYEDRCINGITNCGGKYDDTAVLSVSPRMLSFTEAGDEQSITVNTNVTAWRVERSPAWCTTRRSNNRLIIVCDANTATESRSDRLVIVANTLTFEVTLEQAGKTFIEPTPSAADSITVSDITIAEGYADSIAGGGETPKPLLPEESIRITEVRFASKYADGTTGNYGETLYTNLLSIYPRITYTNLSDDSRTLDLHFNILHPDGRLLFPKTGNDWQTEMNVFGNMQQISVFDAPAGGRGNEKLFEEAGTYRFEIACSGVSIFEASFEVSAPPPATPAPAATTSRISSGSTVSSGSSGSSKLITTLGIKAGLNLANINTRPSYILFSPEMKLDFHAGVFVDLSLNNNAKIWNFFSLQPEVNYSRQGFAVNGHAINLDYVVGLLMLKVHVYQNIHVEVGPFASYLLSVSPSSTVISEKNIKLSDLKGGKDVGAAVGLGYDFTFGLTAGARYLYGFSDVANNLYWTNNVIAVSLGWRF